MNDFQYQPLLPLSADTTVYRQLSKDFVSTASFEDQTILKVEPQALTLLAKEAMFEVSHYLRSGHLQQLNDILSDREATDTRTLPPLACCRPVKTRAPPSSWASEVAWF